MINPATELARPKLALGISLISILLLATAVWLDKTRPTPPPVWMPDFSGIDDVKTKKRQFFEYLRPLIEAENERLSALKQDIQHTQDHHFIRKLAKQYRLDRSLSRSDTTAEKLKSLLLRRVDIIPTSLALAQAAIESGWGTSRFAREGYNFFGQWCFSKGCGLVPSSRNADANHEVRRFSSPAESVRAYIHNLNTHASYKGLRAMRREARLNQRPIHGCELATGLEHYSERGLHYVNEIRQLIRANKLNPDGNAFCRTIPIAPMEQESAPEGANLEDATIEQATLEQATTEKPAEEVHTSLSTEDTEPAETTPEQRATQSTNLH